MTTSDLIWRLIELLLKEKEQKSSTKKPKKAEKRLKKPIGVYCNTLLFF